MPTFQIMQRFIYKISHFEVKKQFISLPGNASNKFIIRKSKNIVK